MRKSSGLSEWIQTNFMSSWSWKKTIGWRIRWQEEKWQEVRARSEHWREDSGRKNDSQEMASKAVRVPVLQPRWPELPQYLNEGTGCPWASREELILWHLCCSPLKPTLDWEWGELEGNEFVWVCVVLFTLANGHWYGSIRIPSFQANIKNFPLQPNLFFLAVGSNRPEFWSLLVKQPSSSDEII